MIIYTPLQKMAISLLALTPIFSKLNDAFLMQQVVIGTVVYLIGFGIAALLYDTSRKAGNDPFITRWALFTAVASLICALLPPYR